MIKSKLDDGVEEVELDLTTPEDLVGCSYSIPIKDYVKCPNCNQVVPNVIEDEYEVTNEFEWDEEYGRTDSYGEYTDRKEFICPNCHKTFHWVDESPIITIYTDDLADIPNIDDIVPNYTQVYDNVYEIYEKNGKDDWAKAFDEYMQKRGGNKMTESKNDNGKISLEEATIKALYDGLKDNTEINDVEGLVDDVLVITDPEITTDEYNEVIDRAQEIIEDTPEGDIPLDPTYLGEYVQICPICGGSFVEDHILESGTACPICLETPESFVMVGKLQSEDEVAEDNGLDSEESAVSEEIPMDIEGGFEETTQEIPETDVEVEEETTEEIPARTERPRGARMRRNREVASKELPKGNILQENKLQEDNTDSDKDTDVNVDIDIDKNTEKDNGDKELLLGADADDKSDFSIEEVGEEKIKELENNSAFTWEGMAISDDNLQAIVDDLKESTKIELPVKFYTWKGELFNSIYGLTDSNAYPDDLNFVSIDLDNWSEIGNLPFYKMQVGARWLDDIVDNNRIKQNKIDGIEEE